MSEFFVTLAGNSSRAGVWENILGSRTIAVKSPLTQSAFFPGFPELREYYEMDLSALSSEQRSRLVEYLSVTFGISRDEVERDLDAIGVPIIADDCELTCNNPDKWESL